MKAGLQGFQNNNGTDQPAHPPSLISAFVIHFLEIITSRLAMSDNSNFRLVSVAVQAGLNLTFLEPPKTGIVSTRPNYNIDFSY